MSESDVRKDDRLLAAVAHASIILSPLTNGVGGIITALVIWLTQKEKSPYAAGQALQAMVYQTAAFVVTALAWCCWGMLWMAMLLPPLFASPEAYGQSPPAGLWVGMILMAIPFALWGLTFVYGLYGAVRCLGGHDFKYILIGNWLEEQN
jgi:uncharacterized Tic20 family protein